MIMELDVGSPSGGTIVDLIIAELGYPQAERRRVPEGFRYYPGFVVTRVLRAQNIPVITVSWTTFDRGLPDEGAEEVQAIKAFLLDLGYRVQSEADLFSVLPQELWHLAD
jgi:hypothetical protein